MGIAIKKDRLIVGEGRRDGAFFQYLCNAHNIDSFQIEYAKGIDDFPQFFLGHSGWTRFDDLRSLVVVADNDKNAGKSLEKVQAALRSAGLPAPVSALHWVKKDNAPQVTILQMPFDGTCQKLGCLETLVLEAMRETRKDVANCTDNLAACVGASKWKTHSARDKFALRGILSSIWEDNPNCGITEALEKGLVPLEHAAFAPLVAFLKAAPSWLDSDVRSFSDWSAKQTKEA